jgi:alkaline phosphatase D
MRPRHGLLALPVLAFLVAFLPAQDAGPQLGNGIKIGEVTTTSARVWARLTREAEARFDGLPFPARKQDEPQLPEGVTLEDMEGAVPGADGSVRLRYRVGSGDEQVMPWVAVDGTTDSCHTFRLEGLAPGRTVSIVVEVAGIQEDGAEPRISASLGGSFRTAPAADVSHPASFCVIACQDHPRRDEGEGGHAIYREMLALDPDFLVHTGDTLYYDRAGPFARNVPTARFKWNRFYGLRLPQQFHRAVPAWFIKDDHDTLKNDCWPGQSYGELTFEQGLAIYREQLPVGDRSYRHQRFGRHLELWFLEGREFRSPNRMEDGPDKTILGRAQMEWLAETLAASDATFRVVVSATPIVGPDRQAKNDNHANVGFQHEGDALRDLLSTEPGVVVVCGDRHWQYASHDLRTGLREWGCGPASDGHAGGFSLAARTEEHDYLKICGGFLHVDVTLEGEVPSLRIRHRGVDGRVTHEDVLSAPAGR